MSGETSFFEQLIQLRDQQRTTRQRQLLDGEKLPVEETPIGRLKWYMHPLMEDVANLSMIIYEMELPPGERSGRIRYQGGMAIYVVEGKGRTVIDGEVYEWKKDSLIQLPLRPDGIVYQHFNTDPNNRARLFHAEPNTALSIGIDRGCGFEILDPVST